MAPHYILANFQACQHGVERDGMHGIYSEMAMQANMLCLGIIPWL